MELLGPECGETGGNKFEDARHQGFESVGWSRMSIQ